jgi:hypothetical protein
MTLERCAVVTLGARDGNLRRAQEHFVKYR